MLAVVLQWLPIALRPSVAAGPQPSGVSTTIPPTSTRVIAVTRVAAATRRDILPFRLFMKRKGDPMPKNRLAAPVG